MDNTQELQISNAQGLQVLSDLFKGPALDDIKKHVVSPHDVPTPAEKVKKRLDGLDYVEGSFMDYRAKKHMPLYEYKLEQMQVHLNWILVIVSLKDKLTGNTEIGGSAARIQVVKGSDGSDWRDIIDLGNNLKSAISSAIKDAQKRFGICADVYRRRESEPTQEERERFTELAKRLKEFDDLACQRFEQKWETLGTDYADYLDIWENYLESKKDKE